MVLLHPGTECTDESRHQPAVCVGRRASLKSLLVVWKKNDSVPFVMHSQCRAAAGPRVARPRGRSNERANDGTTERADVIKTVRRRSGLRLRFFSSFQKHFFEDPLSRVFLERDNSSWKSRGKKLGNEFRFQTTAFRSISQVVSEQLQRQRSRNSLEWMGWESEGKDGKTTD